MNATNVFHEALCLFKTIKATELLTRGRFLKSTASESENRPPQRFPEKIEDIDMDSATQGSLFVPFLGKKFTSVINRYRQVLRNAHAHLDPDKTDDLCADDLNDRTQCIRAIPVLRYIARQLLLAELAAQSH